jgi:hypothetical protein
MLQSSGKISLGNIQAEFGGSNPIRLGEYYFNGSYVKANTNGKIPSSGVNKFSNYYGAQNFNLDIKFTASSETASTYSNSNNGVIGVYLTGTSNNWQISCTGKTTVNVGSSGLTTQFTALNSGSYTVTVKDIPTSKSWSFSFTIGLAPAGSSVSGYSLNTLYNLT